MNAISASLAFCLSSTRLSVLWKYHELCITELPNSIPVPQHSLYKVTSSSAFLSQMTTEKPMSFAGESIRPSIVRNAWSNPSFVPRSSSLRAGKPSSRDSEHGLGKTVGNRTGSLCIEAVGRDLDEPRLPIDDLNYLFNIGAEHRLATGHVHPTKPSGSSCSTWAQAPRLPT